MDFIDKDSIIKASIKIEKSLIGVYFLIKDNTIVYVGQTTKGLFRVNQHIYDKDFDSYFFLECKLNELNSIETQYIIMFKPKYNKTYGNIYTLNQIKNTLKRLDKVNHRNIIKQKIKELGLTYIYIDGNSFLSADDFEKLNMSMESYNE